MTALMAASENGHKKVVAQLLDKGADVNAKDEVCGGAYGACTGPRKGAFKGRHRGQRGWVGHGGDARTHTRIYRLWFTRMLPACGSDGLMHHGVRCVQNGWTALWLVSEKGHTEVVGQLRDRGADVNVEGMVCGGAYGACAGTREGAVRGRHRGQRWWVGHGGDAHAHTCG